MKTGGVALQVGHSFLSIERCIGLPVLNTQQDCVIDGARRDHATLNSCHRVYSFCSVQSVAWPYNLFLVASRIARLHNWIVPWGND